jgi:hypothetical protein
VRRCESGKIRLKNCHNRVNSSEVGDVESVKSGWQALLSECALKSDQVVWHRFRSKTGCVGTWVDWHRVRSKTGRVVASVGGWTRASHWDARRDDK